MIVHRSDRRGGVWVVEKGAYETEIVGVYDSIESVQASLPAAWREVDLGVWATDDCSLAEPPASDRMVASRHAVQAAT